MTDDIKKLVADLIRITEKNLTETKAYLASASSNDYVIVGRNGSVFNVVSGKVTDSRYEYNMAGVGMNVTTMTKRIAEQVAVSIKDRDPEARAISKAAYARGFLKAQSEMLETIKKSA